MVSSEQLTEEIKAWLRREKKTTQWLGEQLCVNGGTVRGWFSYRPIPQRYHARLREIMQAHKEEGSAKNTLLINLPASLIDDLRRHAPPQVIEPQMAQFVATVTHAAVQAVYQAAEKEKSYPMDEAQADMSAAEENS